MQNACRGDTDLVALERELQEMVMADFVAVFHALHCQKCGTRDVALHALGLAGLDEGEFMARVNARVADQVEDPDGC